MPNDGRRGLPSISTWNLPGAPGAFQGATQSRVRTQTRYLPVGRELHGGVGVVDRHAQPVREQEGRAHLVHELLVDDPAAGILKLSASISMGERSFAPTSAAEAAGPTHATVQATVKTDNSGCAFMVTSYSNSISP